MNKRQRKKKEKQRYLKSREYFNALEKWLLLHGKEYTIQQLIQMGMIHGWSAGYKVINVKIDVQSPPPNQVYLKFITEEKNHDSELEGSGENEAADGCAADRDHTARLAEAY